MLHTFIITIALLFTAVSANAEIKKIAEYNPKENSNADYMHTSNFKINGDKLLLLNMMKNDKNGEYTELDLIDLSKMQKEASLTINFEQEFSLVAVGVRHMLLDDQKSIAYISFGGRNKDNHNIIKYYIAAVSLTEPKILWKYEAPDDGKLVLRSNKEQLIMSTSYSFILLDANMGTKLSEIYFMDEPYNWAWDFNLSDDDSSLIIKSGQAQQGIYVLNLNKRPFPISVFMGPYSQDIPTEIDAGAVLTDLKTSIWATMEYPEKQKPQSFISAYNLSNNQLLWKKDLGVSSSAWPEHIGKNYTIYEVYDEDGLKKNIGVLDSTNGTLLYTTNKIDGRKSYSTCEANPEESYFAQMIAIYGISGSSILHIYSLK